MGEYATRIADGRIPSFRPYLKYLIYLLQRNPVDLNGSSKEAEITDSWEKFRRRWRKATPDLQLTWGIATTGDAFIAKVTSFGAFTPETRLLEVGPGYGRLLESLLADRLPFVFYLGLDISEANVGYL